MISETKTNSQINQEWEMVQEWQRKARIARQCSDHALMFHYRTVCLGVARCNYEQELLRENFRACNTIEAEIILRMRGQCPHRASKPKKKHKK